MSTSFGGELREFMERQGLTQQDVANRTGIAQPVIGRLLRSARPEFPTICKIAKGLRVDVQVTAAGLITFEALDVPAGYTVEVICINQNAAILTPREVSCTVMHSSREVFRAEFVYRYPMWRAESVKIKRTTDPAFNMVSNDQLLRWCERLAQRSAETNSSPNK